MKIFLSDPKKRRMHNRNKDVDINSNFTFDNEVFSEDFVNGGFADIFSGGASLRVKIIASIIFISYMKIQMETYWFSFGLLQISFLSLLLIWFGDSLGGADKCPGCFYVLVGWIGLMLPIIVAICLK